MFKTSKLKLNSFNWIARALCGSCFTEIKENFQSSEDLTFTVKGEVKRFKKYGVEFEDGSKQNYTYVIYATGALDYISFN